MLYAHTHAVHTHPSCMHAPFHPILYSYNYLFHNASIHACMHHSKSSCTHSFTPSSMHEPMPSGIHILIHSIAHVHPSIMHACTNLNHHACMHLASMYAPIYPVHPIKHVYMPVSVQTITDVRAPIHPIWHAYTLPSYHTCMHPSIRLHMHAFKQCLFKRLLFQTLRCQQ